MLTSAMLGLFSCSLDEYNPSGITDDAIWSTPEGMETLVASAYKWQQKLYASEYGFTMYETGTDLWDCPGWKQLTQYEGLQPYDDSGGGAVWEYTYEGINMANIGIEFIEKEKVKYGIPEKAANILSEFKFLRAWYNWHIVEQWGPVVLNTKPTNEVKLTAESSSVEQFYEVIISDLQYAAENAAMFEAQPGRVTKKAAYGLLARAALSGAYHVPAKKETYLDIAKKAADEIIYNQEAYGVRMYENYADIWNEDNNKQNEEALYRVTFSTQENNVERYGNRWWQFFKFNYMKQSAYLIMSYEYGFKDGDKWGDPSFTYPTRALFELFDEKKDARYRASFRTVWKKNRYNDITKPATGDTALYVSINSNPKPGTKSYTYFNIDDIYNEDGTIIKYNNPFPALMKFDSPKYNGYYANNRYGLLDNIRIRLSEMYLIAAEVEMLKGNNSAAADYINVIRKRAALPGKEAEMQVSAGDINIDFILAERGRELCGEGLRWFDLKRTGKLVEYVRKYNKGGAARNIQEYHVYRPVPSEELDAILNREEFVSKIPQGYNY